jgi:glycosyltransferase involved in cell wall biosynthesis
MLSVWIDDVSSFGTYPIESMASGVPVMGKAPKLIPSWINENNGIWITDSIQLEGFVADFIQNWLEDNVSELLYQGGDETASKFQNSQEFEQNVINHFSGYLSTRVTNFEEELNKQQLEQNI